MDTEEAVGRVNAATRRWAAAEPLSLWVWITAQVAASIARSVVLVIAGFGLCSTLGLSMWWGLPLGLTVAWAVGKAWNRSQRSARVLFFERRADEAEAQKKAALTAPPPV